MDTENTVGPCVVTHLSGSIRVISKALWDGLAEYIPATGLGTWRSVHSLLATRCLWLSPRPISFRCKMATQGPP